MDREQIHQMNINSGAFDGMREDFDKILKRTLNNLATKDGESAEITVKLKISLTKSKAPDFNSSDGERDIVIPKLDHKVSTVMNIKDEESGAFKGNYELVWDDDLQDYVMKPIEDRQCTIFKDDIEWSDVTEENKDGKQEELAELPPPQSLLVGAEDSFEEVEEEETEDGEL